MLMKVSEKPFSIFILLLHLCILFDLTQGRDYEFVLGGLFPVHQRGSGVEPCGALLKEKGIQRLEAMLYAIDQINKNSSWNLHLTPKIVDTCSSDAYALEEIINFLQENCNGIGGRVTGVIGAANSPVSETVANVLRLFKIPQISYASTSEKLDDLDKFPFFFRVVPSDKFQIQVVMDLLEYLDWTYVSFVAAEGDYGEKAVEALKKYSDTGDICFAEEEIIPKNPTEGHYTNVIKKLISHEKAKGVIVFLNEDKLGKLLLAKKKSNDETRILWLGSDSWGAKINPVRGHEDVAEGAITILPKRYPVQGFDKYFKYLRPLTNTRNLWFKEFWETQFDCNCCGRLATSSRRKICTGDEPLEVVYEHVKQEGLVPMVIDSVYVMASALKKMCSDKPVICENWDKKPNGELLKEYIKKVVVKSSVENNMIISFDDKRSIPVNYTIYQYRRKKNATDEDKFEYVEIAEWNPATRLTVKDRFKWTDSDGQSSCSKPCRPGEEREMYNRCCWTCRTCGADQYSPDPKRSCIRCGEGYVPSDDKTSCKALLPEYLGMDKFSPWALIPVIFAVLGIITTAVTGAIFFAYRNTPVIMASGRELCYVILLGVVLCYALTFVIVSEPTTVTCGMQRGGLSLGLSMCYSAIFTKTNRLSRIFNRKLRSAKRPRYITPKSQLIICSCLFGIQVILSWLWLLLDPPDIDHVLTEFPRAMVVTCRGTNKAVFLSLAYNLFLVILCTVYAFKTRKIPENFNEAKYISFTMYASCIIWLAFIPIFFSTWNDYKVHNTIMSMSVNMCGTVALVCVFFPKLYIVVFDPNKNVRYPTTSNSTSGVARPVRFLRPAQTTNTVFVTGAPNQKDKTQV